MARAQRRTQQAVTIGQVAERAGVSAMTVSNVVNGTKNVRDDTRDAVLAAIEALGYSPNTAARALASAGSSRIGLVYQNAQNAFLSAMLVGTLNAASRLGAEVIIRKCDAPTLDLAAEAVRWLKRSGANALLLAPPYYNLLSGSALVGELALPIGAVAHGTPLADVFSVGIDEPAAACDMTQLLIRRGHRRIGFVCGPATHSSSTLRLDGYRQALARAGIAAEAQLVQPGDYTFESGLIAGEALLDLAKRPTAIFASNDDMAAAVSSVAHRRGLRVPEDLAIAGFDDAPIAVKIWPPLTTVRQRIEAMAEHATERLIAHQRGQEALPAGGVEMLGYELVERESTLSGATG